MARPAFMRVWHARLRSFLFKAADRLKSRRPDVPIVDGGFDIVTVVHRAELSLLRIQARSLARYLDPDFAGQILVIVNDLALKRTTRLIERVILPDYGPWRSRVRLIPFTHFGAGLDPDNGWMFQQALKLAISRHVSRPFHVILDAKNHAIKPLPLGRFVTPEGRGVQSISSGFLSLPEHHATCARLLRLDPSASPFCAPMTPFVMHTASVRGLIRQIEEQQQTSIFHLFRGSQSISEFHLYRLYLHSVHRNELARLYVDGPILSHTVWPPQQHMLAAIVAAVAEAPDTLFMGLHRVIFHRLEGAEHALVESVWRRWGLLMPHETLSQFAAEL